MLYLTTAYRVTIVSTEHLLILLINLDNSINQVHDLHLRLLLQSHRLVSLLVLRLILVIEIRPLLVFKSVASRFEAHGPHADVGLVL